LDLESRNWALDEDGV